MSTVPASRRVSVAMAGAMLRQWRDLRGRSQLDLALDAGVSQKHVSFVESGRDPGKRFWTTRDIPGGPALGAKMAARIREALARGEGADGGTYYRNALDRLAADGVR